ncbi:unnamed protein product [Phytomonas sp. EM1]|nr:unnamed protein product [Phytomonas sp. EM1]|eukprot:CCW60789.1 unnamed protein product [Phytomonas sp. isolate EM1]
MSRPTLYTAHNGFPAVVSASRLHAFTHPDLQRNISSSSFNNSCCNHLLDVPIGDADVERWDEALRKVAPPLSWFPLHHEPERHDSSEGGPTTRSVFMTASTVFALPSDDARRESIHKLAPFPSFKPQAVESLSMITVLKTRRQWLPHRQQFSVYQQRMQLLDAVLAHDVVAVVGNAGSGRTLQLPTILSEKEVFKRRRIIVVSANEMAARLTVTRLREERGEAGDSRTVALVPPGQPSEATEGTLILVTTAEVLLRQLLCDPVLMDVGVVIFDDVHLRTEATELCCALLRERASQFATTDGSSADGGGRVGLKKLHVVLNCPDETCSTSLLDFFAASLTCRVTTFLLASSVASPLSSALTVFYLEETIQWLHKCRSEGSSLCRNPELELAPYVEKVDVVTEVMAAADADFVNESKCRSYWCRIIAQAIWHYDLADTQTMTGDSGLSAGLTAQTSDLSLIVVITPSLHWVRIILEEVRCQLRRLCAAEYQEGSTRPAVDRFEFHVLVEFVTPFADFLSIARGQRLGSSLWPSGQLLQTRVVLFMTPELAQTTLPPALNVGLIVDCARTSIQSFDLTAMCDRWSTEYANSHNLRYRRGVAKNKPTFVGSEGAARPCMVIQLIPRMVLHSAQHRRQSADPNQHSVFRLSFQRYLDLYQVFQAREEAISHNRGSLEQQASLSSSNRGVSQPTTVSAKVASLVSTQFIGVPAASANRYEQLRRVFSVLEGYLVASGHLQLSGGSDSLEAKLSNEEPQTRSGLILAAKLRPMGVLDTCMLLPTPVTRLLVFASMFGCFVEATAAAAVWLVGDVYQAAAEDLESPVEDLSEDKEERLEHETECRALFREARRFFAWNSVNDMVSNFNIYKMWLSLRCDKSDGGAKEEAFLSECKVPKSFLLEILSVQINLHELFTSLLWKANRASPADKHDDKLEQIALALAQFPDEVIMSGHFQVCLTAALYPNCVRMQNYGMDSHNGPQGVFGVLLDPPHPPLQAVSASAIPLLKRIGVYADYSLLSIQWEQQGDREVVRIADDADSEAIMTRVIDKTFLYLSKSMLEPSSVVLTTSSSPQIAVLEQAVPMLEDAVVVMCGESRERLKESPCRCRGWSSVLTSAWRNTKRARLLPPPAQLPPVSISIQAYDTVHAPTVILTADSNHSFMLRATTARWLQGLRAHIQRHLGALAFQKGWTEDQAAVSASEVIAAWGWWQRRQKGGPQWLHEERQILLSNQRRSAVDDTSGHHLIDGENKAKQQLKLFSFYAFRTRPGVPEKVLPPTLEVTGPKKSCAPFKSAVEETSVPAYTGKFPSPDVDQIVRMCVKSVATKRTREHEAQLLRDNPDLFIFLDPENEFHEYYLYLLRQAAPDMEVLGDDLEELMDYLTSLECELREELGLPLEDPARSYDMEENLNERERDEEGGRNDKYGTTSKRQEQGQQVLLHEIAGTDGEEEAYTNISAGLQVETAAVSLRKPAALTLSSRMKASGGASERPFPDDPTIAAASSEVKDSQDATPTPAAAPGTLLEKLMAMKTNSAVKATDANPAVAPGSPPRPVSTGIATNALETAHDAEGAVADTPPTAAELMELLTGAGIGGAVLDDDLSPGNGVMPSPPPVLVNPLSKPPPPLPAKVVDERKPSVLVYPLPDRRYGNVPLMLAKALGETMNIRVGPTTIVGSIGRINVPNKKVEARAISLRKFMCVGKKVYIFKNDRIIDNPDPTVYERQPHRGGRGGGNGRGVPRGARQSHRRFPPDDGEDIDGLQPQGYDVQGHDYLYNRSDPIDSNDMELDPTMAGDEYLSYIQELPQRQELNPPAEPSETDETAACSRMPAVRIGVFSDSDEDDVDESDSSENVSDSESGTE